MSGGRYYWWTFAATNLVIADENAIELATAQLPETTSVLIDVIPAPDEGVYIHSRCQENGQSCTLASDAIELLRKDSTVAETIVTSSVPIHAIAAGADELVWMEILETDLVSIRKWQRSTGSITTLVDSIQGADRGRETLAVKNPDFYIALHGIAQDPRTLQKRSLETGALLATYPSGYGEVAEHLRVTDDSVYWTEKRGFLTGPFCTPMRGLSILPLPPNGQGPRSIDSNAHNEPFFVDERRVFYASGVPTCCWSSGIVTCDTESHELRCYHR